MTTFSANTILFDLDGTLVNTVPDITLAANIMLSECGLPLCEESETALWLGQGVSRLVERALTRSETERPDPVLFEKGCSMFAQAYVDNVCNLSHLYPGTLECLETLLSRGMHMAVVTNKAGVFTHQLLKALEIDRFFRVTVPGDALELRKPDPAPFHYAVEQLNVSKPAVLVVGDSLTDVAASRNAGYPVVCVSYGYNHGHDIRDSAPDAIIDCLSELPLMIE